MASEIEHKPTIAHAGEGATFSGAHHEAYHSGDIARTAGTDSGTSLKSTAENYQAFQQGEPKFQDLLTAVKTAQPGTPEWDQVVASVQEHMDSNLRTANAIMAKMASATQGITDVQGKADLKDKHILPEVQLT